MLGNATALAVALVCGFSASALAAAVEAHWDVFNGSTFKRIADYASDFSTADAGNGTWQLLPGANGVPEIGFVKTKNTGSGTVEVHVDQLVSGTYKRVLATKTDFSPADAGNGVWELFGSVNGQPELGFIKLRNTGSGTVEVHWDEWNGSAYKRAGDYTSDFSPGDASFGSWQLVPTSSAIPQLGLVQVGFPPPPPPPPPTPAPAATTVQTTPVMVPVPKPHGRRYVKVSIRLSWTWHGRHTRLHRIEFGRLPKRATISVGCRGRGCPKPLAMTARSRHKKALERSLDGQRYRAGDRLFITVMVPGRVPERAEVKIRDGKIPRTRLL